MKSLFQLVVVTAYFLSVALLTFGVYWLLARPFAEMQDDFGMTVTMTILIGCIATSGVYGMRGFAWIQRRVL